MANKKHLSRINQGVTGSNLWRNNGTLFGERADLRGANLSGAKLSDRKFSDAKLSDADLSRADLRAADLRGANLSRADLRRANLSEADLSDADLSSAHLGGAELSRANLRGASLSDAKLSDAKLNDADLRGANLTRTDLSRAKMRGANLTDARLHETVFANLNLAGLLGLEKCYHQNPSIIDHRTLQQSGVLPLAFLRGVGLPDRLIEYLPSLLDQAIRFYSCFISYSTKDQDFADRLHADLQNKGVRCWFAPHDLPIGSKILDEIDAAIRVRERVVLILSEHSICSDWVEDGVKTAFEEERKRGQTVLFPLRLDDAVMDTKEAWAAKLRADRHIGDFRCWKEHDTYRRSFDRAVRDLTAPPKAP